MLKVENVSKSFGKTVAVDNLSFSLDKGDVAGLLGPNGAGKTTTMRMITSFYFPQKGKILVNGKNTQTNTSETQKIIGYMPENNPLYLDMMVYDYLHMTGRFYFIPIKEIRSQIEETAKSLGIYSKLGTPISQLSKGFKQRVGLAAALVHDPKLLVLDEPTEGLDPIQREEIRKLIKKISEDKIILISTHVMQEVKAMCDKVIIINEGKLVKEGSIGSIGTSKTVIVKISGDNLSTELKKLVKSNSDKVKILDKTSKVKTIEITSNRDISEEISKIANKNNWTIKEMQHKDTLEEVFENLK